QRVALDLVYLFPRCKLPIDAAPLIRPPPSFLVLGIGLGTCWLTPNQTSVLKEQEIVVQLSIKGPEVVRLKFVGMRDVELLIPVKLVLEEEEVLLQACYANHGFRIGLAGRGKDKQQQILAIV